MCDRSSSPVSLSMVRRRRLFSVQSNMSNNEAPLSPSLFLHDRLCWKGYVGGHRLAQVCDRAADSCEGELSTSRTSRRTNDRSVTTALD